MLWIRSDHNDDNSNAIISDWLTNVKSLYHSVDFIKSDSPKFHTDENNESHTWTEERFQHIINLREQALVAARRVHCDHLLLIDADNIIMNPLMLRHLIEDNHSDIIAPMLNVTTSRFYSNFWCDMNDKLYYQRTAEYMPILDRDDTHIGSHKVALVHSTFMINMKRSGVDKLTYLSKDKNVPNDDIIRLAYSARQLGLTTSISNREFYGFMPMPLDMATSFDPAKHERETFTHMLLEAIAYDNEINSLSYLLSPPAPLDVNIDKIYVINLKRRPERRDKMLASFALLGIEAEITEAVDGRELNDTYLNDIGVSVLANFQDPYNPRSMTFGEIGCFLSHYNIWKDAKDNDYNRILILEDDIRFENFFNDRLKSILDELKDLDHDLVYLGRKVMDKQNEEPYLSDSLVQAYYSYWTLGYLLTNEGVSILLDEQPLQKMIPVDEYVPIMSNEHPLDDIKLQFTNRHLKALACIPLLLYPTHYTGESGHITDTEDSGVTEQVQNHIQIGVEGPTRHVEL